MYVGSPLFHFAGTDYYARSRHDAHARLILCGLHCNPFMDYRFPITTDSETSIGDCADQCYLQHSKQCVLLLVE